MNAQAQAWSDFATKVQPIEPNETREAMLYASQHNLQYRDALDILRAKKAREYERTETLDGRYPTTDTRNW